MRLKKGDLVKITLDKPYYLVPKHGWFELIELENFFDEKYNGNIPQIKEITGYISGGGSGIYHINPFGYNTLQLTESDITLTGIKVGDIIVYKNKIKKLEKI